MKENYKTQEKIYDAEVLESSTFDENIIIKILIKAGRTIAKPALEVLEMAIDPYTCLLYTSPSPRDGLLSRMPSSA